MGPVEAMVGMKSALLQLVEAVQANRKRKNCHSTKAFVGRRSHRFTGVGNRASRGGRPSWITQETLRAEYERTPKGRRELAAQ